MTGNIAVVLAAGGRGERCSITETGLPKQFLLLAGEPIYIWSLRAFCNHPRINQIVVVGIANQLETFKAGVEQYLSQFVERILFIGGGSSRQASVLAGLETLFEQEPVPQYVLVHDAARPFIQQIDIDRVIAGLEKGSACALAAPVSDTIKRAEDELILDTINRQGLFLTQTPQAADFAVLLQAYRKLQSSGVATTDDAGVLEHSQVPVRVILGSSLNFKITNADDFLLAHALAPLLKEGDMLHLLKMRNCIE